MERIDDRTLDEHSVLDGRLTAEVFEARAQRSRGHRGCWRRDHRTDRGVLARQSRAIRRAARARTLRGHRHRAHDRPSDDGDDLRLTDLVDRFGRNHAQAVWDAGLAAIAQIDTIVRDEGISCAFTWVPGYLHNPIDSAPNDGVDAFMQEAALAAALGFDATFVSDVPFVGGPGVQFEDQARFHPRC